MKLKLILFASFLLGAAACTERICPTYTQIDLDDTNTEQVEKNM